MDKKPNIYPDLLARYHIAEDIVMFYAGIDGNETFNSYKVLSDVNPFVQDTMKLHYTYTAYHVFGGITGSITPKLTYNASVAQSMINDMPLFITDTLEPLRNRFTVVYDNVKVSNLHGDLDYKWRNKLSIILAGDYNIYNPTNQLKAWYNPALKVSATGKYTLNDKYILKAEFFVVGSQYAPDLVNGVMMAKTLAGYPDLNLGIDYKYNKVFTAFLDLNNIANVAYYSWDNYEMQRFNLLIGIRFCF
jgi:outer membrane receptor protein involved in Fe transport